MSIRRIISRYLHSLKRRSTSRDRVGAENGSMLIETALVLPTFLLLMFGFMICSMLFAGYINAAFAVRAGARYAALHSASSAAPATTAQIQNVVNQNLFLPGSWSDYILIYYGDRANSGAQGGNFQGDLVGVGLLWTPTFKIPFMSSAYQRTLYIQTEAYRVITR